MTAKRGLNFKTPADVMKGASRIMNAIIKSNGLEDCAGKYASIAHVWLKAFEIEREIAIEKEISELKQQIEDLKKAKYI